jgi:hypothetical protein
MLVDPAGGEANVVSRRGGQFLIGRGLVEATGSEATA